MALFSAANVCVAGSQPKAPFFAMSARYPSFTSCSAMVCPGTTEAIKGMMPSQASTPPATSTPAMRGPMM